VLYPAELRARVVIVAIFAIRSAYDTVPKPEPEP
jgi:hypothetical protein